MTRVHKSKSAKKGPESGEKAINRPLRKHKYRDRTEDQGPPNDAAQKSALRYFNACPAVIMPDDMPVKTWPDIFKVQGIEDPFENLLVKDTWDQIVSNDQRIWSQVSFTSKFSNGSIP